MIFINHSLVTITILTVVICVIPATSDNLNDLQDICKEMLNNFTTNKGIGTSYEHHNRVVKPVSNIDFNAPQNDPKNKGSDEKNVEDENNGKSDDKIDNQANNDEIKLNHTNDEKNPNELLNFNAYIDRIGSIISDDIFTTVNPVNAVNADTYGTVLQKLTDSYNEFINSATEKQISENSMFEFYCKNCITVSGKDENRNVLYRCIKELY